MQSYGCNSKLSKTELPNPWLAGPKAAKKDKTMADYFPTSKPTYSATPRPVGRQDKLFLFEKLSNSAVACPMKWLLEPEPERREPAE